MGVGVERDADVSVSQELLDGLGVLAHLEQHRGAGVPEVVDAPRAGRPARSRIGLKERAVRFLAFMVLSTWLGKTRP